MEPQFTKMTTNCRLSQPSLLDPAICMSNSSPIRSHAFRADNKSTRINEYLRALTENKISPQLTEDYPSGVSYANVPDERSSSLSAKNRSDDQNNIPAHHFQPAEQFNNFNADSRTDTRFNDDGQTVTKPHSPENFGLHFHTLPYNRQSSTMPVNHHRNHSSYHYSQLYQNNSNQYYNVTHHHHHRNPSFNLNQASMLAHHRDIRPHSPEIQLRDLMMIQSRLNIHVDSSPGVPPPRKYTIESNNGQLYKVNFPHTRFLNKDYVCPRDRIRVRKFEQVTVMGPSADDCSKFSVVTHQRTRLDIPHQFLSFHFSRF